VFLLALLMPGRKISWLAGEQDPSVETAVRSAARGKVETRSHRKPEHRAGLKWMVKAGSPSVPVGTSARIQPTALPRMLGKTRKKRSAAECALYKNTSMRSFEKTLMRSRSTRARCASSQCPLRDVAAALAV
jgi:hypothetical protein